jgi:hypothetical protein
MGNDLLITLLGFAGLYMLLTQNKKKEGFRFAEGDAVVANPNFPSQPPIRSDPNGAVPSGLNANTPNFANPGASPNYSSIANFAGQNQLLNNNLVTSNQAQEMLNKVGRGSPQYQEPQLINPDMKYSSGLDPTNANNFMYNRTIFAPLKRRYGNEVDFIRGDLDIAPEQRGWFDARPPASNDIVQGYIASGYQDIEQETAIRDSIFQRNTDPQERANAAINPWGDEKRVARI